MAWESSSLSKIKFSLLVYFCFSLDTNSNNCSVSLDIIFITISSYCFSAFFYVSDFSFFFYLCLSLFVYAYQKLIHLLQWKCFPECTIWNSLVYWKYPHYYSGIFINYLQWLVYSQHVSGFITHTSVKVPFSFLNFCLSKEFGYLINLKYLNYW